MSFEISGTLIEKYPVVDVNERFRKREFVITKIENTGGFEFTDYLKFQLIQDKCNLIELYEIGDELKVYFNLRGRKWEKEGNVSYFTNLEAWKIDKIQTDTEEKQNKGFLNNEAPPPDEEDMFNYSKGQNDDLPF